MLRKLIKYDMKATSRNFAVLYIIVMALAVLYSILDKACGNFHFQYAFNPLRVTQGIFAVLYGLSLFGVNLFTVVLCMRYFYDNLFKDEGYLMHTLPVTPAKLIWSKVIISAIWGVATVVISIISLMLVGGEMGRINPSWFNINFLGFQQHPIYIGVLLMVLITAVVSVVFIELWVCASLSIGSLMPKHHRAIGVGMIIAFGVVHAIIAVFIIASTVNIQESSWLVQTANALTYGTDGGYKAAILVMAVLSGYMALFSVVYFIITQAIMKNHLNLE
ncbi:hypothetical protein [Caproicibacterium amylolyticum]|uniref:Uncharacterized protein n=1 Tax=Caproicibacterium amylolyticum TaxID=2766537 RepID=A0A7G9WDV0_9FIRM|nr:hypothetical protein [Caproicibacterium amylolyticum]QNO16862.1 hypothetical protein H6X83_07720 [Caproicibacterium amylolyticum]